MKLTELRAMMDAAPKVYEVEFRWSTSKHDTYVCAMLNAAPKLLAVCEAAKEMPEPCVITPARRKLQIALKALEDA